MKFLMIMVFMGLNFATPIALQAASKESNLEHDISQSPAPQITDAGLNLQQAEQLAVQRDSVSKSFKQNEMAFVDQARATDTWQDPRIKLGMQAVPIDTFDFEQENMTQLIVGYQQMLPRGDSNTHASESMMAMSRTQTALAQRRQRQVLMQVRQAWLDVVLQKKTLDIIQANRVLFEQMLDISQSFYASGRQQQQDVVQAELEISLVDDRLERARSALVVAKANLAKWVGEENMLKGVAADQADLRLPGMKSLAELKQHLENNPELIAMQQQVIGQQKKLALADDQYSPQWGFDVTYGFRSGNNGDNPANGERSDFLTAMVTLDLPIFTENKQDRNVSAEKQRLQATRYRQLDVNRELLKRLMAVMGRLQKLKDRHQLYEDKVLPQARQNAEVSFSGYQSGVVSFFTLTRARVTELNTRLADLQIDVAYNKAFAELQYLIGENS
ncbi:Heavy metal RND efflux outer membrane protein, CzcC family [hydrothermal vent metagenome]|uniref:Heavy metal RND efflux outer membrane protein, CzcC family n=1 Tax=hydrothermal vent metagenome TaxID=652676 RepID=A0A3B0X3E6_9ZZZZ